MKYKILIKKCEEPQTAQRIALEVAKWSGSVPGDVYGVITQKAICVKREAGESEAQSIKSRFGAIGAEVELVPVSEAVPVAAMAAVGGGGMPETRCDDEDDEPGRVLTDAEFAELAGQRSDVFTIEKTARMRNTQLAAMILATVACAFMSTRTVMAVVAPDFLESKLEARARVITEAVEREEKKTPEEMPREVTADRKQLKPSKTQGVSPSTGGGDPRERVVKMGVLGLVSGQVKGVTAGGDIFAKGGFASDIDAILSGMGGLKTGGGGVGRRGASGIGYGPGSGSGFCDVGCGGGIGDLMSSLMGGGSPIDLKRKTGDIKISQPNFISGHGALTGGRSRASIQRVVMQNMAALRHVYNRRLRENPELSGRVTVKFAINEFGDVTFAQMVESTMSDPELEKAVVERVRSWKFERIDKPGDVTEVTYPFVFAQ